MFLEPTESTNPEHLRAIQKRKLTNYIKKPSEKTLLTMLILVIIIFGLGVFFLGHYLGETYKWNLLIFIAIYLILYSTISHFTKNRENKVAQTLKLIGDIPFAVFYLALQCALPAFSMIAGFMFMVLFALSIPLLTVKAVDFCLQINLAHPTYIFVTVSAATILCVHCSKFMFNLISKLTPLRDWGDHESQKLSLDLALYVLNKKNIIFLIYFAYFIFMAITGFKQIQYGTYLVSSEIDTAVTKAFLLFIAYTNMVSKSLEVDINRKELLSKILRLLLSHDKQA